MSKIEEWTAPTEDRVWALWRKLVKEFGLSRLIWTSVTSRTGWGFYGVDMASTLRGTPMARGAIAVLTDVSIKEVGRLGAVATVNAQRSDAMWRMAVLFYVSVPFTLFLAGLQGAPALMKTMFSERGYMLVPVVIMMTLWLVVYFANQWRAKQIVAVLDLALIERGVLPGSCSASSSGADSGNG